MAAVAHEAGSLSQQSVDWAKSIDHAATGSRLGRYVQQTEEKYPGAIVAVRNSLDERLSELSGVGEERGLFLLAADCATTAAVHPHLEDSDRAELRVLWRDLLSR